ncbi:hypothetical protein JYU34_021221 [Plutella xylostella]|uniref:Uncharacterized protein n=1 Tax=Plutella xylostella TaxID=51655 RepID=A0ABQ7PT94_PLUXY|nr:hypothetical protein JYU34_021221 [Plutella xylostella]
MQASTFAYFKRPAPPPPPPPPPPPLLPRRPMPTHKRFNTGRLPEYSYSKYNMIKQQRGPVHRGRLR